MYELKFRMYPVVDGFCKWSSRADTWDWKGSGPAPDAEQDYNAAFAEVMVWCESNLRNHGDRTKPDWWMYDEIHGRFFFGDGANAMLFKIRWC
ncbi:MAG: hypothetical protein EOP83_01880 [Verrucomicrobiaceae bacterium]|nr:MAG: hypothetical protein EOP83_01880 [Verrucomicrobiaceae bacterium]